MSSDDRERQGVQGVSPTAEIVYLLATHDGAMTASEIADWFDMNRNNVTHNLTNLWRNGLLVRRKRRKPNRGGPNPYEYALAPPEVYHDNAE